jgi:signal transduction histidine kinase
MIVRVRNILSYCGRGGVATLRRNHMLTSRYWSRLKNAGIGALMVACGLTSTSYSDAAQERQKVVLVVYPIRQEGLSTIVWDNAIRQVITGGLNGRLDYYAEYFDFARIPNSQFPAAFADYLGRKYAGTTFDVVIAVSPTVFDFLNQAGSTLFPGVPVVYYTIEPPRPRPMTTGVVARMDLKRTIDVALQVHPDLQQVFVVSGTSEYDKFYRELAQTQLRAFDGRLVFTYLSGLSMSALLQHVGDIPQRAVIYYLMLKEDADGNKFNEEAIDQIAAVANRPIYTWLDVDVGRGAIGGSVMSGDVVARAVADLALRVLKGESPDRIPVHEIDPNVYAFDWRQLRRFGVNEARLPAGSIIQFRQPSAWDQYRWYILGAATILVLQSALIGGLVVQRARRRRAEVAVRESASALRQSYEQNQDLAGRLISAQEEERTRIARELHDDLSQQLGGLGIALSGLKRKIGKPGAEAEIDRTVTTLQDRTVALAESVRNLSHELHPSVLEHVGLVATLQRHCADVEELHHLEVSFSTGDNLDSLTPAVALCLFRVAQEALSNAARHARASTISVQLMTTHEGVELRVVDDGIGFVASERTGSGLGLRSIDERVRLSKGSVTVESRPGHGTNLLVRIPLAGSQVELVRQA